MIVVHKNIDSVKYINLIRFHAISNETNRMLLRLPKVGNGLRTILENKHKKKKGRKEETPLVTFIWPLNETSQKLFPCHWVQVSIKMFIDLRDFGIETAIITS